MNQSFLHTQEPTEVEQVVVATIQGLRALESLLGYEFSETIYHIQKLHDIKSKSGQELMAEYAEASGKGQAACIVALNKPMSEDEFINTYSGHEATAKAQRQVEAIYGEDK